MSVQRRVTVLAAFVLSGAGTFLLVSWIYDLLGWDSGVLFFQSTLNLALVAGIMGAGIGLLSWLGFAIGKRRWSQSGDLSGGRASATYRRGFGRSLLLFLALGTLLGLIITVPRALGPTASTASGGGETLYDVIVYVSAYGTLAVLPFVSGLLTGSRPRPGPVLALLGGLALAIGAAIVYLVPVTILILLVTPPVPACATTYSTGCIYFGPIFDAAVLDLIGLWTAATVGVAASAAAFAGVVALGLTDGA